MDYQSYIKAELLVLVPVLYIIGVIMKKSKLNDSVIPLFLGLCGIVLSCIWVIATEDIVSVKDWANAFFVSITQGILLAGTSVYANQLYKQTINEVNKND